MIYRLMIRFTSCLLTFRFMATTSVFSDLGVCGHLLLHHDDHGTAAGTQQPGMPNMKFIMYLMPLMMLFFFNNYASGLSLYYFVSNLLTIVLMLVIKNFVISEEKIFAQIEENKKKPKGRRVHSTSSKSDGRGGETTTRQPKTQALGSQTFPTFASWQKQSLLDFRGSRF